MLACHGNPNCQCGSQYYCENAMASPMGSRLGSTFHRSSGLGVADFLATAVGISTIIGTAAQAGISAYGTIEGLNLQQQQLDLQGELSQKRLDMEAAIADSQKRLIDVQVSGAQSQQEITNTILQSQANLAKAQADLQIATTNRQRVILERDAALDDQIKELEAEQIAIRKAQLDQYKAAIAAAGGVSTGMDISESLVGGVQPFGAQETVIDQSLVVSGVAEEKKNNLPLILGGGLLLLLLLKKRK